MSGRMSTIEQPMNKVMVYTDENEDEYKPKIAGSLDVEELKDTKGKVPTPIDFIKLVQSDPDFANRFCYCFRNDDFYDFRIVAFEVIEKDKNERSMATGSSSQGNRESSEYMTVSANGIVHFVNGDTIKRKPFFQKYKKWKTFSEWKKIMRDTMILKRQDFLNRELFLLDGELAKPMINIRSISLKITKMDIMKMNSDTPRTL